MNLFDKYHIRGGEYAISDYFNSIWHTNRNKFPSWELEDLNKESFFTIVQSNTGINVDSIWEKS
jgi:hypothetical protein